MPFFITWTVQTWHSIDHTHLCVQHLYKCVLHGLFFPICSWPCIVLFNCYYIYIYSFYLKSLGNASFEHVYTNAPHVRPIISAGLKLLCLVIQWCIHNASSISSCCWLLFRCYLSSLCSFMLFSVWQMDRKWVFGHVWEMLETVVPNSVR